MKRCFILTVFFTIIYSLSADIPDRIRWINQQLIFDYHQLQSLPVVSANYPYFEKTNLSIITNQAELILNLDRSDFGYDQIIDTNIYINYDTSIYEDIILVGDAVFEVENCNFTLKGDLTVIEEASFSVNNAVFNIPQDFIYQHTIIVADSASLSLTSIELNSTHLQLSAAVAGRAEWVMDSVDMSSSFITFAIMGESRTDISNTDHAGEFVMFTPDSANLYVRSSDSVLVWLGFPKNSAGEIADAPTWEQWVDSFIYPDLSCVNINYHLRVESIYGLFLASMAEETTEVVVKNSKLIALGNIFMDSVSDTISGLIDYSHYDSFDAPFPDRQLRLINTEINAWNLYFYGSNNVTMTSSIFGELLTAVNSHVLITNSTCDGAGGHIGAGDSSFFSTFYFTCYTDALCENLSTSVYVCSNFLNGKIIARDRSLVVLFNCLLTNPVQTYDSAVIMKTGLYLPTPAFVDDTINIPGSATMFKNSISPFSFHGYYLQYSPASDTSQFFSICSLQTTPVDEGILTEFITVGLPAGEYMVKLWYLFNYANIYLDSFCFSNNFWLTDQVGINENTENNYSPEQFAFICKRNNQTMLNFNIIEPGEIELRIYNLLGQCMATNELGQLNSGVHQFSWDLSKYPQGIYFVKIFFNHYELYSLKHPQIK